VPDSGDSVVSLTPLFAYATEILVVDMFSFAVTSSTNRNSQIVMGANAFPFVAHVLVEIVGFGPDA